MGMKQLHTTSAQQEQGSHPDLDDVEKTASIAAVNPGATEARAVLPGPTSLAFTVSGDWYKL